MLRFTEMLKGKQHKIDKNKNGKVDAHDFKLLRKEEQELEEASYKGEGKVETKKYSWGTMKTVHHGSEFSVPLHPEHHQAIAKLKDQQEHKFKTEDGKHWTAKRSGDKVHFQGANNGGKTSVSHSTMKEEVEIEEAAFGKDKMANMRAAHDRHMEKALAANKAGDDTAVKVHQNKMAMLKNKMDKLKQNEEVELELSDLDGLNLDEEDGLKKACWKGYEAIGMKMKNGKKVPNCVPVKEEKEEMCDECDMPESKCECDHEDKKEMKEGKHVVGVTISDPNHTMVTQRNAKKMRKAKVSAPDKDTAINTALAYYKKRGYKVHDHNYIGLHTEEVDLEENAPVAPTLDRKYIKGTPENKAYKASKKPINGIPTGKMKEEVELDEATPNKQQVKQAIGIARDKRYAGGNMTGAVKAMDKVNKGLAQHPAVKKELQKQNEETELDELNKSTLASYAKKATHDARIQQSIGKDFERHAMKSRKPDMKAASQSLADKYKSKSRSREAGIGKAIDRLAKEEYELDEARVNGREYASQGVMHPDHAKMDIHKVSGQHVDFYASKTGDKMQGKVTKNDGKSVHIQAHKELGDGKLHKFKVTPNLPKPTNEAMDMSKADMGDVIKDFQQSDAPQFAGKSAEKRRQMAIAAKLQADKAQKEERELKSYKHFMEEIYNNLPELEEEIDEISEETLDEMEFKGGRYVHKGSYGTSYQGDDDDDDDKPKAKPEGEKRGRGRPKGASSGARQKGSATGKKRTGVDYTGYPLHLPGNK